MSAGPWIEWFPTVISCKATIDNLPCSACAVRCRGVGVLVRMVVCTDTVRGYHYSSGPMTCVTYFFLMRGSSHIAERYLL